MIKYQRTFLVHFRLLNPKLSSKRNGSIRIFFTGFATYGCSVNKTMYEFLYVVDEKHVVCRNAADGQLTYRVAKSKTLNFKKKSTLLPLSFSAMLVGSKVW